MHDSFEFVFLARKLTPAHLVAILPQLGKLSREVARTIASEQVAGVGVACHQAKRLSLTPAADKYRRMRLADCGW